MRSEWARWSVAGRSRSRWGVAGRGVVGRGVTCGRVHLHLVERASRLRLRSDRSLACNRWPRNESGTLNDF